MIDEIPGRLLVELWYPIVVCLIAVPAVLVPGVLAVRPATPTRATVFHAVSHGVAVLCLLFVMYRALPHYKEIFYDIGVAPAEGMTALFGISDPIVSYWHILAPGVPGLLAIDVFMFHLLSSPEPQGGRRVWYAGVTTAFLVAVILFFVGVSYASIPAFGSDLA